jgi:hypothetical protein
MGGDWANFEQTLGTYEGPNHNIFVPFPSHDPGLNSQDYLWTDTDTELTTGAIGGIFGSLSGSSFLVTPNDESGTSAIYAVGGFLLAGIYHSGTAAPYDTSGNLPGDIIISARAQGYWEFVPIGTTPIGYTPGTGGSGIAPSSLPNSHFTVASSAEKQNAIDLLNSDSGFKLFKLKGVDIDPAILKSIKDDTVVFTDLLSPGEAQTNDFTKTIYLSNSYRSDPVGFALVLAHEGLHQAFFDIFGPHGNSIYEESLGALVSAYAMSGLSQQNLAILQNDSAFYADVAKVKSLSDQGNFSGIMQYIKLSYGGIPDLPASDIYNVLKGSF